MTLFGRWLLLAGMTFLALVFLVPTAFRSDFKDQAWISKPISLGLDLSGGVYLVYEVQTKEAVKSKLQSLGNAIRAELRDGKVAVKRVVATPENTLDVTLMSALSEDKAKEVIVNKYKEISFRERSVDDGGNPKLTYGYSEVQAARIESESVDQAIETLRSRVDQFGVSEPIIQRVGEKRILLEMPGVQDIESVKKVVGSVAKLEFRLVPSSGAGIPMPNKDGTGTTFVEEIPLMTGDAVDSAHMSINQGEVNVGLSLTGEGSETFGRITSENTGRQLAIILDGKVYSSPRINEAIYGGNAIISGSFSIEEAKQLAVVLRAGALPAPLVRMEERTIGPTLGAESIQSGIYAIAVGVSAIFIFMLVYYKKSGLLAIGTLIINALFLLAILSAFGSTITLPGLAGIALTIGMAVDSNVIIFERIKDELKKGARRDEAINGGFHRAFGAIFDSNITTLLTGIILFVLGTGPIKGFAVTLNVGVFTTVFCAVFASRLGFDFFQLKGKKWPLSI
jgi:preprotein translocase subunit SecD